MENNILICIYSIGIRYMQYLYNYFLNIEWSISQQTLNNDTFILGLVGTYNTIIYIIYVHMILDIYI